MTTTNRPDALNVLTQAADAAEKSAAEASVLITGWYEVDVLTGEKFPPCDARLIAASNPDHWRTIAATLRTAVEWNRLVAAVELRTPEDYATTSTAIAALLPLAEQVLRDLPGTAS